MRINSTYTQKTCILKNDYGQLEHGHCEVCWARFGQHSEDLHYGYYEVDSKSWICKECYDNFRELFKWTTENEELKRSITPTAII